MSSGLNRFQIGRDTWVVNTVWSGKPSKVMTDAEHGAAAPTSASDTTSAFKLLVILVFQLKFRHTRAPLAGISEEASDGCHDTGIPQRRSTLGETPQHCKRWSLPGKGITN